MRFIINDRGVCVSQQVDVCVCVLMKDSILHADVGLSMGFGGLRAGKKVSVMRPNFMPTHLRVLEAILFLSNPLYSSKTL